MHDDSVNPPREAPRGDRNRRCVGDMELDLLMAGDDVTEEEFVFCGVLVLCDMVLIGVNCKTGEEFGGLTGDTMMIEESKCYR